MKTVAAIAVLLLFAIGASAQVVGELNRRQALQHYRVGQELLVAERFEEAAAQFTTAIELDPLLTLAHYGRGQAYMALKRYASAVQAFIGGRHAYERLADLRQRDLAASNRLRIDEINELRESVRRMNSQVKVDALTAARISRRLEELETLGATTFGEAVRIPAELSLALGSAYFRGGHLVDAEREWKAAVAANAGLGEAHNNLAVLYMQSDRKKEAEEAIKAAERARFRVHPQLKADIQKMQ